MKVLTRLSSVFSRLFDVFIGDSAALPLSPFLYAPKIKHRTCIFRLTEDLRGWENFVKIKSRKKKKSTKQKLDEIFGLDRRTEKNRTGNFRTKNVQRKRLSTKKKHSTKKKFDEKKWTKH